MCKLINKFEAAQENRVDCFRRFVRPNANNASISFASINAQAHKMAFVTDRRKREREKAMLRCVYVCLLVYV